MVRVGEAVAALADLDDARRTEFVGVSWSTRSPLNSTDPLVTSPLGVEQVGDGLDRVVVLPAPLAQRGDDPCPWVRRGDTP